MLLSQVDFLKHIRDEAEFICESMSEKTFEEFENDEILQRAIFRSLEIIGEATKHLDFSFRVKYPAVDWKGMAGTRDKLIHQYMDLDKDLVFNICQADIPILQIAIQRIISIEEQNDIV